MKTNQNYESEKDGSCSESKVMWPSTEMQTTYIAHWQNRKINDYASHKQTYKLEVSTNMVYICGVEWLHQYQVIAKMAGRNENLPLNTEDSLNNSGNCLCWMRGSSKQLIPCLAYTKHKN